LYENRLANPAFKTASLIIFGFCGEGIYIMGMIALSPETEALAHRLAAAQNLTVEAAIAQAVKTKARLAGASPAPASRAG
jgi:hypothetical protein